MVGRSSLYRSAGLPQYVISSGSATAFVLVRFGPPYGSSWGGCRPRATPTPTHTRLEVILFLNSRRQCFFEFRLHIQQ